MTDVLLTETHADQIVLVTINRPEARDAINSDVAQSLAKVVARTEQDPGVWVVILTGAGDGSSAPAFIEKRASRWTGA